MPPLGPPPLLAPSAPAATRASLEASEPQLIPNAEVKQTNDDDNNNTEHTPIK